MAAFLLFFFIMVSGAFADERKEVRLTLGDVSVVARGPVGERRWGRWQFPGIERLSDGRLHVTWHVSADSASAYGSTRASAVSSDEGATWTLVEGDEAQSLQGGTALPNGERLKRLSEKSIPLEFLTLPEPAGEAVYSYGNATYQYYRPSDLPENISRSWPQMRLGANIETWVREYPKVDIPGQLVMAREGVLALLFFMGLIVESPDGSIWTSCYWRRLIDGKLSLCIPTFVRSTNGGRTWEFMSDISYCPDKEADPKWEKRGGFTEPEIAFMPDGSILAIMRTTDGNGHGPLYTARSTDNGQSWSRPEVFDSLGVLPQLLVLENGVTLASYGRPGVYVRATSDPSGSEWEDRIDVPLHGIDWGPNPSCGYTRLIALDDDSAMIAYSDFGYPDDENVPRKTILVRKISVAFQ